MNAKDSLYDTALHYCATYGHLEICRLLLQCNADVNATASMLHKPNPLGWTRSGTAQTPLHHATYHGHVEVCRLLLQCKANVDARDCSEQTPLQRAVVKGHFEVCDLLLQSNAHVEARDSSGWNLMHHSVARGSESICRLLIASKANVTIDSFRLHGCPCKDQAARNMELARVLGFGLDSACDLCAPEIICISSDDDDNKASMG